MTEEELAACETIAADPLVRRVGNVAKAGQVLCDALGDDEGDDSGEVGF